MARYFEKTKEFFGEAFNRPKPYVFVQFPT